MKVPGGSKMPVKGSVVQHGQVSSNNIRMAVRGNRVVLSYLNNSDTVLLRPLSSMLRKVITVREILCRNKAI